MVGSPLSSSAGFSDVPRQYGPPPPSLRQTMMLSSTSSQNRQWVRDNNPQTGSSFSEVYMSTRQLTDRHLLLKLSNFHMAWSGDLRSGGSRISETAMQAIMVWRQPNIRPKFSENCTKMKKIRGGFEIFLCRSSTVKGINGSVNWVDSLNLRAFLYLLLTVFPMRNLPKVSELRLLFVVIFKLKS